MKSPFLLAVLVAGCGAGEQPTSSHFTLSDCVASELRARPAAYEEPPPLEPDQASELEQLLGLGVADPAYMEVVRQDVARIREGAPGTSGWLRAIACDGERPQGERVVAVDLLSGEDEHGARALLTIVTDGSPGWLRARAAWRLSAGGLDLVVPALLLPLKYETDHEAVLWLALALAQHGNFAGLEGLNRLAADENSPVRDQAVGALEQLVQDCQVSTVADLAEAWSRSAEERGFPVPARSEAYRFRVLAWIDRLREFQLRGVDDARFLLERLDGVAARELAKALHDKDVYVRVHSAQCLQRMGKRALPAVAELAAALDEPIVAPTAALALGRVGGEEAKAALIGRIGSSTPFPLRLAATRAFGYLLAVGAQEAQQHLAPLLGQDAAPELAQASAESLLRLDAASTAAMDALAKFLLDARVDPSSTERALTSWFEGAANADLRGRWFALAAPTGRIETSDETRHRREQQASLVREANGARPGPGK